MRFIEIKRDSILLSEIIMVNFDMINMIYSEKANGKLLKYLTYKILIINYLMYCLRKICILNICSSITNIYNWDRSAMKIASMSFHLFISFLK